MWENNFEPQPSLFRKGSVIMTAFQQLEQAFKTLNKQNGWILSYQIDE